MNGITNYRAGTGIALAGLLTLFVLSGADCLAGLGILQDPLDPIIGASIESTSGETTMTWSWTYQGLPNGIRPASIAVTIFRQGTNIMPNGTPETVSGTVTQHQFTVSQVNSGAHSIRFECTYPAGTIPSTALYEHSASL